MLVKVRDKHVMLKSMYDNYMDGYVRELEAGVGHLCARVNDRSREQSLVAGLFLDDTILLK